MSTRQYDQYYCAMSPDSCVGFSVLSSSEPKNNSELVRFYPYIADMNGNRCCKLFYSGMLEKYVWMRLVEIDGILTENNDKSKSFFRQGNEEAVSGLQSKVRIAHILHPAVSEVLSTEDPESAACLAQLPPLPQTFFEIPTPSKLQFNGELPQLAIELSPKAHSDLISYMLFGFPSGRGVTVICDKDDYDDCYAGLAVYLLGLMPKSLAKKVSVSMAYDGISKYSLINIVTELNENFGSFLLKYNGERLVRINKYDLSPVRRAFCNHLADLYQSDKQSYYRKLDELNDSMSEVYRHNLPPEILLYSLWANAVRSIHLDIPVPDAIKDFLGIVEKCGWKEPDPRFFFKTMLKMCVMFLDGFINCSDQEPAAQLRDGRNLIELLSARRFPSEIAYPKFLAGLIRHLSVTGRTSMAKSIYYGVRQSSSETASDVQQELDKTGFHMHT